MPILAKKIIRPTLGSFTSQDPGKTKVVHLKDLIEDILMKGGMHTEI